MSYTRMSYNWDAPAAMDSPDTSRRKPVPYAPSILIVDDDPVHRSAARRALEDTGYFVFEANSGRGALRTIEERHIDVAVVDLSMPDMDGIELLRMLRNSTPDVKVVSVSSFMRGAMLTVALKLGAAATLEKGRPDQDIVAVVCKLLGHG